MTPQRRIPDQNQRFDPYLIPHQAATGSLAFSNLNTTPQRRIPDQNQRFDPNLTPHQAATGSLAFNNLNMTPQRRIPEGNQRFNPYLTPHLFNLEAFTESNFSTSNMARSNTGSSAYLGRWPTQQPINNSESRPSQGYSQQARPTQPHLQQAPARAPSVKNEDYLIQGTHGGMIFEACPDEHFSENVWRVSTQAPAPTDPTAPTLTRSIKLGISGRTCYLELKEYLLRRNVPTTLLGYILKVPPGSYEILYIGYKQNGKVYEILLKLKATAPLLDDSMIVQTTQPGIVPLPYDKKVHLLGWPQRRMLENSKFLRIRVPNADRNINLAKFHPEIERILRSAHLNPLARAVQPPLTNGYNTAASTNPPRPPPPPAALAPSAEKAVLSPRPSPATPAAQPLPSAMNGSPPLQPAGPTQELDVTDNQGLYQPMVGVQSAEEVQTGYEAHINRLFPQQAAQLEIAVQQFVELPLAVGDELIFAAFYEEMLGLGLQTDPHQAAELKNAVQLFVNLPAAVGDEAIFAGFYEGIRRRNGQRQRGNDGVVLCFAVVSCPMSP